ncbi:VanW family protein [Corynebacterium choanae]|uniref:VanW like protein n=1 Tax=Corynebacterium choanae TaxID=1862358 RepID=A0A3G6J837_9CORY|nr:VanW family protein [Corynebacterium choanae]AZA12610.1 VanW like protein [Corynebacterium choanae]
MVENKNSADADPTPESPAAESADQQAAPQFAPEDSTTTPGDAPADCVASADTADPAPGHTKLRDARNRARQVGRTLHPRHIPQLLTHDDDPPQAAIAQRVILGIVALLVIVFFALWLLLYTLSAGRVPAGTYVGEIDISRQRPSQAIATLEQAYKEQVKAPITVQAADASVTVDPVSAGMQPNWEATVHAAGTSHGNPLRTISVALFDRHRHIPITVDTLDTEFSATTQWLSERLDREPRDGAVTIARGKPRKVDAQVGIDVTPEAAAQALRTQWLADPAAPQEVTIDAAITQPAIAEDQVDTAYQLATAATSGELVAHGQGADGTITPVEVGDILSFTATGNRLDPVIDLQLAGAILGQGLDATAQPPVDAHFATVDSRLTTVASAPGRRIDWEEVFHDFDKRLFAEAPREWEVTYQEEEPAITDEAIADIDASKVLAQASIRLPDEPMVAQANLLVAELDGRILRSGEKFSLEAAAGDSAVQAPASHQSAGQNAWNSVASALFNAALAGGMQDIQRTANIYAFDGLPLGKDADWVPGSVDFGFSNPYPYPVVVSLSVEGGRLRAGLFAQEKVDTTVKVVKRSRTDRAPRIVERDEQCVPAAGQDGMRIVVERRTRNRAGDLIANDKFESVYAARPVVTCIAPEPVEPDETPSDPLDELLQRR